MPISEVTGSVFSKAQKNQAGRGENDIYIDIYIDINIDIYIYIDIE